MLLQDDSTVGVLQFLEPFWVSDGVNLIERVRKITEDYYFFQEVSRDTSTYIGYLYSFLYSKRC